jgi:tetrapyrrole methylase family protein / MazG family protein
MGSITIVGLGPGRFGLITLEAWQLMQDAEQLLLRTAVHPTVEEIKKRGVKFHAYDGFYEQAESFEKLYQAIAADVLQRAQEGQDIVYAVPGSPLVAERTVVLLRSLAAERGVQLTILPGMSFVEVLYVRLGIDPIDGLTILDAEELDTLPCDWPMGLVVTQVYNQELASGVKLSLMEVLPDDFTVTFIHDLGLPDEELRQIPLFALDRQPDIDHLTSLYVPPQPKAERFELAPVIDVMHTLRAPGGCPWDVLQTHKSLRRNIIEEVYEVLEAIELEDEKLLCEELGDLLLQIVFHARMAEEAGSFSMQDVIDGITDKLIRRHPHIFGDVQAADAGAVVLNWEKIKQKEKPERQSVLDGVPAGLPALMSAEKLQKKASRVGFDWPEPAPVWEKIDEEIGELQEAVETGDAAHIAEELGDVLFSVVNLSRFLQTDAELSLMQANRKFSKRFAYVESCVKKSGRTWQSFTLEELDALWDDAKTSF